ncbi:MAG: fimbrial biogenesis chaperone [Plesiomonas shigelloides]
MNNVSKFLSVSALFLGVVSNNSMAAISLDRTRAIFNGDESSMTLGIKNDNLQLPYLAQSWIEDSQGEKKKDLSLLATPPIQRVEPGAKSLVRIVTTPEVSKLPKDKESLFYFNVREIPPRAEEENTLQIALQTKIKLFYRPKSIINKDGSNWQSKVHLRVMNSGYKLVNDSPYYLTVIGIGDTEKKALNERFNVVMVSPMSSVSFESAKYKNPYLAYIDDYGGRPTLKFSCDQSQCSYIK